MTRIRTHTNPFHYIQRLEKPDFSQIFPNFNGTLDLEIGVGRGIFLVNYAKMFPEKCLIGIDVRKQIITLLSETIKAENLENIFLVHSPAQICLEDQIEDQSLENVFVFHPDPWVKKRHQKRRIVNAKLLNVLAKKMKSHGKIYLSTDVAELAAEMQEIFKADHNFMPITDQNFWQKIYQTNWSLYSQKVQRDEYFLTYEKNM